VGGTVIITAGTTTALITKYLLGKCDVHIVTNNTLLLTYTRNNPHVHVTLIICNPPPQLTTTRSTAWVIAD
jgi:DeoR family galactitol utilization operon repressor